MIKNFSKYLFMLVTFVLLLTWSVLWLYQYFLQQKMKKELRLTGEAVIDDFSKVKLGGVEQWIRVRGHHRNNPILLFLHGGPGAPLFPAIKKINSTTHIESLFTVVYWEQRGTGKSFHCSIPRQSMHISQFISDIRELCHFLQTVYCVPRVYLLGRSFGSLVGILTIQKYPELFYGYVGVGQLVTPLLNDSLSYEETLELAKKQKNADAVQELYSLGYPPYNYRQLINQRRWLTRLTAKEEGTRNRKHSDEYFFHFKDLLGTLEYSLLDIFRMGMDPYFSLRYLWNQNLYQIDLIQQIHHLDVPVLFLCGENDYFTPGILVKSFYDQLEAPAGKWLIWFENSGHFPEYEEPHQFQQVLRNFLISTGQKSG